MSSGGTTAPSEAFTTNKGEGIMSKKVIEVFGDPSYLANKFKEPAK